MILPNFVYLVEKGSINLERPSRIEAAFYDVEDARRHVKENYIDADPKRWVTHHQNRWVRFDLERAEYIVIYPMEVTT